jgi:short-subunit dehydrogenase involved in D-alanine esterification of teichoic acids
MAPRISPSELRDGTTTGFATDSASRDAYKSMVVVISGFHNVDASQTPELIPRSAGASSGIGEQIALLFASQGSHIVLAARRMDKLRRVAENCRAKGGTALCVECDVTRPEDRKRLVNEAAEFAKGVPGNAEGVIHRVFLNAGVSQTKTFVDLTESEEDEILELNFVSNVSF